MIRIQLSPEPQWFELGHGVRLQLLPLTTALMVATRSDPAVQALEADASNDSRAAVFAAALARRAVVDWEGVGDADGNVLASASSDCTAGSERVATISAVVSGGSCRRTPWPRSSHCGSGESWIRIMGNLSCC